MSVLEENKIDVIATRRGSDVVKLVISDHVEWEDLATHCALVQEKINAYIAFVESGQLAQVREPKIPEEPRIIICLAVPEAPPQEAMDFLGKVKEFLSSMNIGFEVNVHDN